MNSTLFFALGSTLLWSVFYAGKVMAKRDGTAFYAGPSIPMMAVWLSPILATGLFVAGFWWVSWYWVLLLSLAATVVGGILGSVFGLTRVGPVFSVVALLAAIGCGYWMVHPPA
ncbi:hypothetical protein U4I37_16045 [Stenotrophomonas maltophilia]|uniref:hypothetical protein n=1 Tax=Stenotrophomonas maltophilia TaxID=40324 RepID=UPI002ACC61E6|nr:hypothetical protein [Stenotrophomonas maltophilia]MDZ5787754.1 hypothetical protein [Stenotrophomonas maltophilia]